MPYKDRSKARDCQRRVRESDRVRLRTYAREYARARKAGIPWVNPVPKERKDTKGRFVGTRVDIAGQRYGNLTALRFSRRKPLGNGYIYLWEFQCDCGTIKEINRGSVTDGATSTCGMCRNGVLLTPEGATRKSLFRRYERQAKQRGHKFTLEEKEFTFITKLPCSICGISPSQVFKQSNTNAFNNHTYFCLYTGIDRIDNKLGYEQGNVRPCCKTCNMAKHALSEEEFQTWADRLVKFRTQQNPESPAIVQGNESNL